MPEVVTYAVVEHSTGPHGGFVVRKAIDGHLASPYQNAKKVAVRKTERGAQAYADKLNRKRFG
jgi:hypothetical protein